MDRRVLLSLQHVSRSAVASRDGELYGQTVLPREKKLELFWEARRDTGASAFWLYTRTGAGYHKSHDRWFNSPKATELVAPEPKSWFVRQKVLGANIHETEGLLERIIASMNQLSSWAKGRNPLSDHGCSYERLDSILTLYIYTYMNPSAHALSHRRTRFHTRTHAAWHTCMRTQKLTHPMVKQLLSAT